MSRQCFYVFTMLAAAVLPVGCSQPTARMAETAPATAPAAIDSPAKPAKTPEAVVEAPKVVADAPKVAPTTVPIAVAPAKPALMPATKPAATKPATKPTTKPAPKPAAPRTPADAVGEVNRNPKRHDAFLKQIKDSGQHDLLFIGDSITDFWPSKGRASWAKFADYKPLDIGISGERTEDVLFRLNHGELEGYKPKVAVIMVGTNNIGHFKDEKPEWVAAGIEKIVKTVQAKQPDTKILLLGVFPRETVASTNRAKVKEINAQIAKLDDGSKVKFMDIGAKFLDDKGELPADVMPDKLHPSAKGYDIWYDAIAPVIAEMMK